MSRLDSRDYRWFAICVPPQKEFVFQRLLDGDGFATFVPTRKVWRFRNHQARVQGKKHEVEYPIMPRYVFVGMNDHTPGWAEVFRYRVFFDRVSEDQLRRRDRPGYRDRHVKASIVGFDGQPYQIPNRPLYNLMLAHNAGTFNAPDSHKYMQTHYEFGPDDRVITDDGLFEGRVQEISGNMAKVFIEIFGGYREIEVSLDKLVAA